MAQKASVVRIEGMEGRDPSRRRDRRSLRTRAVRGAILAVGAEAVAALEDLIVEAYVGRVHRRERRLGELDLVLGVKLPRVLCSRLYSDLCELQYIKLEKGVGPHLGHDERQVRSNHADAQEERALGLHGHVHRGNHL